MPARHKPTGELRGQVEAYAGMGVTHDQIATLIGISKPTLHKHYRRELDVGDAKATAQVAGALFKSAKAGNVAAQIFWMKARAGWREKQDVTVRDGKPLHEMTDDELRAVAEGRA